MIKEFALEPDAITASYREFCYFTEKFGVSQGRVISEFPKKWRRMVCESAQRTHAGKVELTKIVERLKSFKGDIVFESSRPGGDGTKEWINRAIEEHARQPFSAIIASANPMAQPEILVSAELDDSDPRFQSTGQLHITRTAAEIVGCVELLLGTSKIVKLIDPHFDPRKKRWVRMLTRVVTVLGNNGQTGVTLEIHITDNESISFLKPFFDSCVSKLNLAGVTVQVFQHPNAVMHNRFILTNIGGASYSTGLDDNEDGGSTTTDLVTLLAPDVLATEWHKYSGHTNLLLY
jgi:hypothetical protein